MFLPLMLAFSPPIQLTQAEPCQIKTIPNNSGGYSFTEINNCPILEGTFYNNDWKVEISQWEPAAYSYRGTNRINGNSIHLISGKIGGTVDRPQYKFRKGNVVYVVSFQNSDPNTIRVEIFENDVLIFNQLLHR